jgi:hypothetical protein
VAGLAAGTVAAIRRGTGAAGAQGLSRLGRDGRVRPVNAADPRLKAQQEISARPETSLRKIAKAEGISLATAKNVRDRLRRGDDLVPQAESSGRGEGQASAGRLQNDSDAREKSPGAERSLDWSLQRLMRDASPGYSEPSGGSCDGSGFMRADLGRSYLGWHRHVTIAALAQALCTLLRTDPKARAPG